MDDPRDDFTAFYRRHVRPLLAYFHRRTADAELAADLTAETFAAALDGAHRFKPERVEAIATADATARELQVAFDGLPADQRELGIERLDADTRALAFEAGVVVVLGRMR